MSVLIIDDEEKILELLKRRFEMDGIAVTTTTDPEEGLALHRQNLYPVILTDIRMPKMDGHEVIINAKKIHPTSILYVMTAYGSLSGLVQCIEEGASDYFTKPFADLDFVTSNVKDALARQSRWRVDLAAHIKMRK